MSDNQNVKKQYEDTREQKIAQSYDRNISVTANAGAGKTSVLQKRFIKLLIENEDLLPKEIVAITFTRNAASEIRSRITEAFDKELHNKSIPYVKKKRLYYIRERLQSAQISTIHSFCSALIRDYPIESGVTSNFSELSEAESVKIRKDAITNVLTRFLNKKDENQVNELIDIFGRYKLERMINRFLDKRHTFFKIAEFYEKNDDKELLRIIDEYFNRVYVDKIRFLNSLFIDILTEIKSVELKQDDKYLIDDFIKDLKDLEKLEKQTITNEITVIKNNKIIDELIINGLINKGSLSFPKRKLKGLDKETIDELNLKIKNYGLIKELAEAIKNKDKQPELIRLNRLLINLVSEIIKEIDIAKEKISGLDFEDLLIKTYNMLKDDVVAEKIRNRYKYLMVDEFQDTNNIQYEIVKRLLPELDKMENTAINLFIVGDAKQSIYGFRNADVRVFKKATKDIINLNKKLIRENQLDKNFYNNEISSLYQEAYGKIELSISFRHKPVIAAFVNRIFHNLDDADDIVSDYKVEYSDFICSQNIEELKEYSQKNVIVNESRNKIGNVDFLITIKPNDSDDNTRETEKIAQYILKLVKVDKYKFSDIAILSRAKTKFKPLIEQLQQFGIPYLLNSGKDFFRTQEVMDIISFLKFINNKNDDLALAAILRATFFDLNDSELFLISSIKSDISLFEKLKIFAEANNKEVNAKIKRAFQIIKEVTSFNSRVTISQLILTIMDKCKWLGTFANTSSAIQMKANINKFIAYARSIEQKGFKNLSDFLEEIELINKENIDEGEALFVSNENLVNIMSIHAAKGLEFPVVILYDTNNKGKNSNADTFFSDEELGFAYPVPIYDNEKKFYVDYKTPLMSMIKYKNKLKEKEEEKRILYVALTRAKERLVISSTLKETKDSISAPQGLFKYICDSLNIDNSELFTNSNSFNIAESLAVYQNGKNSEINFTFPISIIRDVTEEQEQKILLEPINQNISKRLLLDGIKANEQNLIYSATRFITYKNNFDEYLKRYILRMRENDDLIYLGNTRIDDLSKIEPKDLGTIIHNILENIDKWFGNDNHVDEIKLKETIINSSKRFIGSVSSIFIDEIKRRIQNVLSADLIKNNIKYILQSDKELSLSIPFEADFVEAKIDLLFKKDAIIEIWDWKTNNIELSEMYDTANHYKMQMQLYAYVVLMYYPDLDNIKSRLLFTHLASSNSKDDEWTFCFTFKRNDLDKYNTALIEIISKMKEIVN